MGGLLILSGILTDYPTPISDENAYDLNKITLAVFHFTIKAPRTNVLEQIKYPGQFRKA